MAKSVLISVLPWVGATVVLGVVGAVLGVSGIVGRPVVATTSAAGHVLGASVAGEQCPGGAVIGSVAAGSRVLAVARSVDTTSLGVRDPHDTGRLLWLPAASVVLDPRQRAVSSLPVSACPTLDTASPVAPPESTAPTTPSQHADIMAPVIASATATPDSIYQHGFTPEKSVVAASATDDIAVSGIDATWAAVGPIAAGSAHIAGGSGSFTFGPYAIAPTDAGTYAVPVTLVAHDAAGNSSAPRVLTITVEFTYG